MRTERDRLRGAMYGLLIGDALGVPYEFHPPDGIPPHSQIEMAPPPGFARAHAGVPPGTWSDDGAQALCLAEALVEGGEHGFYDRLADKLVRWRQAGHLAVDGRVFDVGIATDAAIRRLRARRDDGRSCGGDGERDLGNGALMRVLPLALWVTDERRLVEMAMEQSRLTHAHPVSRICCALYCVWVRGLLAGRGDAWTAAVESVGAQVAAQHGAAFERVLRELREAPGGSGYVIDTLRSARALVETEPDYASVVRGAIALGHDTDTTACVAGGAAGAIHGESGIPQRWRDALRGRNLAEPLVTALVEQGAWA